MVIPLIYELLLMIRISWEIRIGRIMTLAISNTVTNTIGRITLSYYDIKISNTFNTVRIS